MTQVGSAEVFADQPLSHFVSDHPQPITPGFDSLVSAHERERPESSYLFTPNPAYEQYLRMHKVMVGKRTAPELEQIHRTLASEQMPRYLTVAGSAAIEAALIKVDTKTDERLGLLDSGVSCWERGLELQLALNKGDKPHLKEHSAAYRMAMDIAVSPLLRGIILGDITSNTIDQVFKDSLCVALANNEQLEAAWERGDNDAIADHTGFAYECNALLALNRIRSKTWFAIPALARADSGHHHPQQSHDLSVVRQKWGTIKSIMPVEIKSAANGRAKRRYKALLVRGKMHLSVPNNCPPGVTLKAIAAVETRTDTVFQREIVSGVSSRLLEMLKDYYAGEILGEVATSRSLTGFRDNSVVISKHPGLRPAS